MPYGTAYFLGRIGFVDGASFLAAIEARQLWWLWAVQIVFSMPALLLALPRIL